MSQNISLWGATYSDVPSVTLPKSGGGTASFTDVSDTTAAASDVASGKYFYTAAGVKTEGTSSGGGTPAISIVDTTDSAGGTIRTITALDISDTTAVASDVASGKYFYTANGTKTQGTASGGGGGATQHVIHLEFTDSTDADIDVYYDDSLISTMITSYDPVTYGQKTVDTAALDNVVWYTRPSGTWETVLNSNVHVNAGDPYNDMWLGDLGDVAIAVGSVWRVTIDGTSYTLTATGNGAWPSPHNGIIGNPLYLTGQDDSSGVPFAFEQNPWGAWSGGCATSITGETSHLLKIERQVSA